MLTAWMGCMVFGSLPLPLKQQSFALCLHVHVSLSNSWVPISIALVSNSRIKDVQRLLIVLLPAVGQIVCQPHVGAACRQWRWIGRFNSQAGDLRWPAPTQSLQHGVSALFDAQKRA